MSHSYTTETFIQASAKLDKMCQWLEDIGIDYSRTRVRKYQELFSCLARHQLMNDLDGFSQKYSFPEFVNAGHEVAELERIYSGLNSQNDTELTVHLKKAIKGHELYVLDREDRSGRDFSFELVIAAKFTRCGYHIDFGNDADVRTEIEGNPFYVECKRLKSNQKIQKRIKHGLKQLHKRYGKSNSPEKARGILALSIGKVVNPGFGILEADSQQSLGKKAYLYNKRFIETYRKYWQNIKDRRTLGAVIVFDVPGVIMPRKRLERCHEVTLNNSMPTNTPDHDFFLRISNRVFPNQN